MVLTDHNIAICWVWVAYIVKLCVCVRYMVVWWCAEVANCPSARVLNAGAFAARAVCGGAIVPAKSRFRTENPGLEYKIPTYKGL